MTIKLPDISDIPALKDLWKEAFADTDDFINLFFSLAFSKENSLCAYDKETLTASLYWFDAFIENEKVAYIYGVATKKTHRGMGISTALIKKTHELLKKSGYKAAILVPADDGLFNFYSKSGYQKCCFIDSFEETSAENKANSTKISAEEYLNLRNKYLPKNSIVFDNKRLPFLASITDFYKSDDFIFAKNNTTDKLNIIEFFGDRKYIPLVASALGFSKASVRSYGKEKAFAMYFPLTDNFNIFPEYLGFAFD